MTQHIQVTESSGNVFADLGLDNPEELSLKSTLVMCINSIVKHSHLTQVQAAKVLGISQPQVSDLARGRLDHFSVERLLKLLNALNRDVDIVIKKKPGRTQRHAYTRVKNRGATSAVFGAESTLVALT